MANALWLLMVLIATLLFYIYRKFYTYDRRFMELASRIPGPRRLPLIGSAFVFGLQQKMILKEIKRTLKTYQSICGIWLGPLLYVIVSKPKDVEVVLSSIKCNEKEHIIYHVIASILGDGVSNSKGEKWKKHRRMLNPIFSLSNLQVFVDTFYSKARETYDLLEGELENPSFNIFPYNEKYGINILFANNVTNDVKNEFAYEKSAVLEHIYKANDCFDYRIFKPWLYFDCIYNILPCGKQLQSNIKFSQDLFFKFAGYLKTNMNLNGKKEDVLQRETNCDMKEGSILKYLLQLQAKPEHGLTDQDILDEWRTIFGAAFETSTAAIGFIIFLLSRHPEVQEQIVNEIHHDLGSLDEEPLTYDDLSKLHYLDRVVKEGLRLYPTVPVILRHVSEDTPLSSGITLPRGSSVIISIYSLHQDPESFPDPEKFNPDNFLPENVAKRSTYAYAPFSHGPRNCIGQKYAMLSLKTQLVVILRKFCVMPTDIEPELYSVMSLKSKNGIHVGLQKRARRA